MLFKLENKTERYALIMAWFGELRIHASAKTLMLFFFFLETKKDVNLKHK